MAEKLEEVKKAAQVRADELTQSMGIKVHPLVFMTQDESEPVVGFVKEPSRAVKLAVLDKAMIGGFSAANQMLDVILLKEHSDSRIYSESPEHDKFNLGATNAAYELVNLSVNMIDKKK